MKSKLAKLQKNRGVTYVELIVVISIFIIMTSISIFSYHDFQSKVDIKNLASDIALKFVEAQKSSAGGKLPSAAQQTLISSIMSILAWKPSYGVYFNTTNGPTADPKSFFYFTDANQDGLISYFNGSDCDPAGECISKNTLSKKYYIADLALAYQDGTAQHYLRDLTITFKRPSSVAIIKTTDTLTSASPIAAAYIVIALDSTTYAYVTVFPSGRIIIE